MRSGLRGVLVGALALVALQTAVQPGASGRLASLFGVPAAVARRFIDPTVPAIPDRRAKPSKSSKSSATIPGPFQTGAPIAAMTSTT